MSGRLRSNDTNEDDKYIKGGTDDTLIGNIGPNLRFTETLEQLEHINLSVSSASAVQAKVGASPLADRKLLVITNLGNKTVFYGGSGVTSSNGQVLLKTQTVSIPCSEAVLVFLIAERGTQDVRVAEYA
jgi:hypothetical protein